MRNRNYKQEEAKLDKQFLTDGYTVAGSIERYCLEQFFDYLNVKQDKYLYQFTASAFGIHSIAYDGTLITRNRLTNKILSYHIVEAKVRQNTAKFDELIYEKKKHNALLACKREKDDYYKKNYSDHFHDILYINFVENKTFLFDISYLMENNLLGKITNKECNKVTIAQNGETENKKCFMLNKSLGVKYNFIFNANDYHEYLLNKNKKVEKQIEHVKKTYSIF